MTIIQLLTAITLSLIILASGSYLFSSRHHPFSTLFAQSTFALMVISIFIYGLANLK